MLAARIEASAGMPASNGGSEVSQAGTPDWERGQFVSPGAALGGASGTAASVAAAAPEQGHVNNDVTSSDLQSSVRRWNLILGSSEVLGLVNLLMYTCQHAQTQPALFLSRSGRHCHAIQNFSAVAMCDNAA